MANVNFDSMLNIIVEDANGDHVYSSERATVGYIAVNEYLHTIRGVDMPVPPVIDLVAAGSQTFVQTQLGAAGDVWRNANPYIPAVGLTQIQVLKLILLNAVPLMGGVAPLTVERAAKIGLLRARLIKLGALIPALANRAVTYDEVTSVDDGDDELGLIVRAADVAAIRGLAGAHTVSIMTYLNSEPGKNASAWITGNAELIWNIAEHLVRSRGHHYKDIYIAMIKKMYISSSSGNVEWPVDVQMVDMLRTAVHPFGIKALPLMAYKFIWHGKIGNGMIRRITGASNGFAAATTAYAGLAMIASEPWYDIYIKAHIGQANLVKEFAQAMLADRYSYHESANLYGLVAKRQITLEGVSYTMAEVDMAVSALAPVLQGFILWSVEQSKGDSIAAFSFANAKVLSKRASSNPTMVSKLKALLDSSVKMIADAETTKGAIMEAFPNMLEEAEEA